MRASLLALPLMLAACSDMATPGDGPRSNADAGEVQRLFTQGCYLADFDERRSRAVFRRAGLREERITNASIFTSPDGAVEARLTRFSQPGANGQQCSVRGRGVDIVSINGLAIRLIESEGGPKATERDRRAKEGIAILRFDRPGQAIALSTSRDPRAAGRRDVVAIELTRVTQ